VALTFVGQSPGRAVEALEQATEEDRPPGRPLQARVLEEAVDPLGPEV
jgi:hypothetical protein